LKTNAVDSGTVSCVIHEAGKVGGTAQYRHLLVRTKAVETHAGMIASKLVEYAKGKDGKPYSGATLEIRHPWPGPI
jgi:hypothetical protein